MSQQPDLLAALQESIDRALGRPAAVHEHTPVEPIEPWMSERDQDALMDGRAANEAAHEPDLDSYGRWSR